MKNLNAWFWMVIICTLILPAASRAETVYVSEEFEITMRTGPGNDRKIISLIKSGNAMELLERGQEWSMVRIPSGKEGWVLNRYITTSQPSAMALERVRKDYDVLAAKYKELKERFDRLDEQKKATDADLSQSRRTQDELSVAYETLKKESADFLKLKQGHQEMTAELEAVKTLSVKLDLENLELKRNRIVQWVLTGSGIMLVGFFIGFFSSSRRRPRSSLY
ncbi:MAG: TIGR04211 family SH3 domain-containing protein [Desulfobacterales bacterium]